MALSRRTLILGGAAVVAGGLGARAALGGGLRRGPVTLEFWGGPSGEQRQAQVKAWTAKHPDVQVNFKAVGATGAGVAAMRKFAAAVAGGKVPHVVDFDRFQVASYVNWRMFRPIDDYLARDKFDLGRFAPTALEEAMALDGKPYGLPNSLDVRLLYWHKDAFAQAGLDPNRPPATWDELRAAATSLARRGRAGVERLGFDSLAGQASLHPFAWQTGGGFQTPDGKTATLALPPNQAALEWLTDVAKDQGNWAAIHAFREKWAGGAQHPFLTGQLAMQYELDAFAGEAIARLNPDLPFGVAPLPARKPGDPPLTWSGGYCFVMSRTAQQPDAGWEFLKWLVSEDAIGVAHESALARASAAGGLYVPGMTAQPALDQQFAARYQTGVPALDQVPGTALGQLEHARFREVSVAAAELWDGVLNAQAEAVSQTKSPKQALEDNNATVQRALEQAWIFVPK